MRSSLQDEFALRPVGPSTSSRVLRSRQLCGLNARHVCELQAMGVTTIYDLRKPLERNRAPLASDLPFRIVCFDEDLQDAPGQTLQQWGSISEYGDPGERPRALYRRMANHGDMLAAIARDIASANGSVIVSCVNGKDRTGVLSAVLMKAAGFGNKAILDDYLATNAWNASMNARDFEYRAPGCTPHEREVIWNMFIAHESYLRAFFDEIDAVHGSFEAYRDARIGHKAGLLAAKLSPYRPI